MPNWVRKLRRRRRYIIPGLIWFAAVALFIAVWIYLILQTTADPDGPFPSPGRPPVSPAFAGCRVRADRRYRTARQRQRPGARLNRRNNSPRRRNHFRGSTKTS
jgi:hypothetical protein